MYVRLTDSLRFTKAFFCFFLFLFFCECVGLFVYFYLYIFFCVSVLDPLEDNLLGFVTVSSPSSFHCQSLGGFFWIIFVISRQFPRRQRISRNLRQLFQLEVLLLRHQHIQYLLRLRCNQMLFLQRTNGIRWLRGFCVEQLFHYDHHDVILGPVHVHRLPHG